MTKPSNIELKRAIAYREKAYRKADIKLEVGPAFSQLDSGMVIVPSKGTFSPIAIMHQSAYQYLQDHS